MKAKTIQEWGERFSLRTAGMLALMLAAALLLASCATEEEAEGTDGEESERPRVGVTLSDVSQNPEEFIGADVTVSGEVGDLVGPQAFTIGGEEFLGTDELLILGAEELPEIVTGVDEEFLENEPEIVGTDDIVQITGTVGQLEVNALEDDFGSDIDEDLFAEYEDEPFIVAEEIFLDPRVERAGETLTTPVEDISGNPMDFVGANVETEGVVADIIEPRIFVLAGELADDEAALVNSGVLVVNPEGNNPNLIDGENVSVDGPVRDFDIAGFEEEIGIELDEGLYSPYAGRPAIVAEDIQTEESR